MYASDTFLSGNGEISFLKDVLILAKDPDHIRVQRAQMQPNATDFLLLVKKINKNKEITQIGTVLNRISEKLSYPNIQSNLLIAPQCYIHLRGRFYSLI